MNAVDGAHVGIYDSPIRNDVKYSFGGASYFWLHACSKIQEDRPRKMAHGGLRILRVFITNIEQWRARECGGNATVDVEPIKVGTWNDTQLGLLDDLFRDAFDFGIKINLAPHDRWALGCWQTDAYVIKYNIPVAKIAISRGKIKLESGIRTKQRSATILTDLSTFFDIDRDILTASHSGKYQVFCGLWM